jgi:hypothetical protein
MIDDDDLYEKASGEGCIEKMNHTLLYYMDFIDDIKDKDIEVDIIEIKP